MPHSPIGPIAIDGDAASGKTTVGRELARRYGFTLLDTGRMYRAFTLAAQRAGVPPEDVSACEGFAASLAMGVVLDSDETRITLAGEEVGGLLDSRAVEDGVSGYAAIPGVRAALVRTQRDLAARSAIVVVGRDIGTVVLPDAPAKLFLVASEEVQVERRAQQNGLDVEVARANLRLRNSTDRTRATSPTARAADACEIDTSFVSVEEVVAEALAFVAQRLGAPASPPPR